jgi:hypothetical protein
MRFVFGVPHRALDPASITWRRSSGAFGAVSGPVLTDGCGFSSMMTRVLLSRMSSARASNEPMAEATIKAEHEGSERCCNERGRRR